MAPLLILFIQLGVGGIQRKIVDICNFLASYKPDLPIYIILRNRDDYDLGPEIQNKNVKIINYQNWIKNGKKIPFFFPVFVIFKIWQLKPKSILAFLDFASIPAIWAKLIFFWRKTRLVLSEDHYASQIIPRFKFGRLRNLLIKIFYPVADVIFTCSQATKKDLIRSYSLPAKKIKIIRNWTTFRERKTEVKEKKYDLIYIGRFYWTKNLRFLIESLAKLKKFKKNIKLCLLGSGQEKESLKELVKEYHLEENVDFINPRPEVEKFLNWSRVFVLSSRVRVEGFPIVILEAMAAGIPVLSRDFTGAREFLREEENCYFFRNEKEFIDKTLWLLNNPQERKKIAASARDYVKKHHSPQNILGYLKALDMTDESF